MPRKILSCLVVCLVSFAGYSQSISQSSIGAAGSKLTGSNQYSLTQSVAQQSVVVGTFDNGSYILTNGFGQWKFDCELSGVVVINDTAICEADTLVLSARGGNEFAWWPTTNMTDSTSPDPKVRPSVTTTYYVIVTDTLTGCSTTDSVTVFVSPRSTLSGQVTFKDNGDKVSNGKVFLIEYDSLKLISGQFPRASTENVDTDGNYTFTNVSPGEYLIVGRADKIDYPTSLPTYFDTTRFWEEAKPFTIACDTMDTLDFQVIRLAQIPVGTGRLRGRIVYDSLFNLPGKLASMDRIYGDEVEGVVDVDVILQKIPGSEILGITQTDGGGYYDFDEVPLGDTIQIYVEIPGMKMDTVTYEVFLSDSGDVIDSLNFIVDSVIHIVDTTGLSVKPISPVKNSLKVFPNPFRTFANISFELQATSNVELVVYDLTGRKIETLEEKRLLKGKHNYRFKNPNNDSSAGVYIIRLFAENRMETIRLIEFQ